ncbi:fibronectin type III domain-containing protein [Parahaliea mediterranea]|uniref:fibronectin type III domain-containing protein n=1 Tax=Parahaliea mediterranea TaxID=651086 RepID=UPI00321A1ABE
MTNGGEYYLRLDDADGHTDPGAGDFVDVAAHFAQPAPTIYSSGMAYVNTSAYSSGDHNFRIYASGGPPTLPGAPTIGTATAGNAQATVAFTAPANDGGAAITGYTATSAPGGLTGTCSSSPCTVAGLTNGTAYTFTVVATNSAGNSPASAASNAVTPAATVPGAPTIGTATAGNAQATVAFTAPDNDGGAAITGYTATSAPGGLTGTCSSSPCTVAGLTNGTAYTFTVVATNSAGNSPASAASNAVTPATVPGAPSIGTATAGNAQATVAFTAPANGGGAAITGYTATSAPGGLTGTCSSSPCTVAGLTNGTAYTFTVVATNSVGDSPASASSNAVTPEQDSDGDGTLDTNDAFPSDPVEDVDTDGDGIGDNGDAGGTGIGIRVLGAPLGCTFGGPVENSTAHLDTAPGEALDKQLHFTLNGCGASVTIEALFGEDLPPRSVAYKVSASGEWVEIPGATIAGNKITYTVTDNGPLDDDAVLGQITDPVTAVVPPIEPVPVLPVWLLAALGSLIGLAGLRHYSR